MASDDVQDLGAECEDARLLPAYMLLEQEHLSVLSVDVFDTLIWRITPEPVDAFVLLGRRLQELGLLSDRVNPALFAALRERAEVRARTRVPSGRVPEVTLGAIYRELPPHLFTGPTAGLPGLEVDFEASITFPDLEVCRLAHLAKAKLGLRLVLVSDTYFSAAELRRILDRQPFADLAFDEVFTSSQHGVGKGSGLFDVVLDALGVPAAEVLHVGDNADADVERPCRKGIHAVLFDRHPSSLSAVLTGEGLLRTDGRADPKPTLDPVMGDFGFSALRAKAASSLEGAGGPPATNPYWRFGATVLGPVFAGFAEWVHERAQEEGVGTVWCLMREGEFLSRLVNGARGYLRSPVRAEPLWLSRQVCSRAAIFEAGADELHTFLGRQVAPTVGQLCQILGVPLGQVPDLAADADTRLDDTETADRCLRRLGEQPHVRASIVAHAASLRGRMLDYLAATIGAETAKAVVVDLGWGCTIQAKLDAALAAGGSDLRTVGLYLLTNEGALERTLDGVVADGFLARGGFPAGSSWITRSPEILEQICMHDEGTLVDFSAAAEPVLQPTPQSPAQILQRAAVQRGILAFQRQLGRYREVLPAARAVDVRARPQLVRTLTRFIVSPTTEEVGLFSDWMHDQNFGSEASDTVVRASMVPTLQYLTPRQLLEIRMNRVYWPFGMAASHNPQLALATSAVLDGTVPAAAFEASQPCEVRVFVDSGGGFSEAVCKLAGPNVNGLSYVEAEVATSPLRGVMIRCADGPGVLRLDRLALRFRRRGELEPLEIVLDAGSDLTQLQFRNGVLLADNVLLAARAAPEIVYQCPPELAASAYRVDVDLEFAWMRTPRLRGRRSSRAETAVQLGRKVAGKARNVWMSSGQDADEHFRPDT